MFIMSSAIHQVRFDSHSLGLTAVWDCARTVVYLDGEREIDLVELDHNEPIPDLETVHDLVERYFHDTDTNARMRKPTTTT